MVYKKSNIKVLLGPEGRQAFSAFREKTENEDAETPRISHTKITGTKSELFGKIGDTHIYKRTRPFQSFQGRPTLERTPSNLELSGHKVEREEDKLKIKSARVVETTHSQKEDNGPVTDSLDSAIGNKASARSRHSESSEIDRYSQIAPKSRHGRASSGANSIAVSRNVLTDFGFKSQRTDTFSGHQRRRGASAEIERQFEQQAERHIRTCQVVGNLKRSSKAQQNYQGLKNTVSPLHTPMSFSSADRHQRSAPDEKSTFARSDSDLNKTGLVPYMIQIRKNVGSISRMKTITQNWHKNNPLPEISGQTLLVGTGIVIS